MATKLKTEWKRIGRSGPTVDGRTIDPQWLTEAAESYNKELYTALLWPEHERWYNMGTIEELRAEANDEGGVDLYALIAPNDFYLRANKEGQKLFTSMELRPNFRDTEKHYLTGCAATDSPASAATSEIRFSKSKDADLLLAQHVEATTHQFDDKEANEERLLSRLFSILTKSSEDDMNKEKFEKLKAQVDTLAAQFSQAFPSENDQETEAGANTGAETGDQQYAALEKQIKDLKTELEQVKNHSAGKKESDTVSVETFNELKKSFDALQKSFNEALQEQPGTDAGDHVSDDDDLSKYI